MSQFAVYWDEATRTLKLQDDTDRVEGEPISHVYAAVEGEIPTNPNPPQIGQHLQNLARQLNVDWRTVSVKNNTKNDRLNAVVKKGDSFEAEAVLADEADEAEVVEPTAPVEPPVEPPKEGAPVVPVAPAAKEKKSTPVKP